MNVSYVEKNLVPLNEVSPGTVFCFPNHPERFFIVTDRFGKSYPEKGSNRFVVDLKTGGVNECWPFSVILVYPDATLQL